MECKNCRNDALASAYSQGLCSTCFTRLIEKKAKRELFSHDLRRGSDIVVVANDGLEGKTLCFIMSKLIKVAFKAESRIRPADVLILQTSMEKEAVQYLKQIMHGLETPAPKAIRPFRLISEKELELYAQVQKISYTSKDGKDDLRSLLEKFEEKVKGAKFGVVKSRDKIESLQKKRKK